MEGWRGAGDVGDGECFGDDAGIEHCETVAKLEDGDEVVRDVEQSGSGGLIEMAEELDDFGLSDRVESAGGLIGDQDSGAMQQGKRDHDALGLADADLIGAAGEEVGRGGELDFVEQGFDAEVELAGLAGLVGSPGFFEVAADGDGRR